MARARASDSAAREWPPVSYWLKVTLGVIALVALAKAVVILRQVLILMGVSMILAISVLICIVGINYLWVCRNFPDGGGVFSCARPHSEVLERKGVKRGLAVAIMALSALVVIGGFIALVVPTIIHQVRELIDKAPDYVRRAQNGNSFISDLNQRFDLTTKLHDLAGKAPSTALNLFKTFGSFVFNTLTVLILTLYFTSALPRIRAGVARLLTRRERERFELILDRRHAVQPPIR